MSIPLSHPELLESLRADLRDGHFEPGERLGEPDLAERYDAPRAAVRSALVVLAAEGLVERQANRGARVRTLTLDEAIESSEVRGILEPLCAQRAAQRATSSDKAALTRIFSDMLESDGDVEDDDYMALSTRFHDLVTDMSAQHAASRYLTELRGLPIARLFPEAFRTAAGAGHTVAQHRAIVDAILAGDGGAARQAMVDDLEPVVRGLLLIRDGAEADQPDIVDDSPLRSGVDGGSP